MSDEIGPALPPGFDIGPALPPGFEKNRQDDIDNGAEDFGIALPPELSAGKVDKQEKRVLGPTLPAALPAPEPSDSSDDELIGPSVALAAPADVQYDAVEEFVARNKSLETEQKRIETEKALAAGGREEWMTSLPTLGLGQEIGLSARTFRNKAAPEQDSSWTKAPNEQTGAVKKVESSQPSKRRYEQTIMSKRDEEIAKQLGKYSEGDRKQSLYEMHQKKLKKEKKKAKEKGDKPERVPFSRETDLQVNKFDEAQRKSVIKKAAMLDSRFGHGSQKYE